MRFSPLLSSSRVAAAWLSPVSAAVLLCFSAASVVADDAGQTQEHFEQFVRPVFQRYCVECHSEDDTNGGLSLTSSAALNAETDSGNTAISPGDPASSEILIRIQASDEDMRMPPDDDGPSGEEIESLRKWIADGAVWPETTTGPDPQATETDHWSFQPIHAVEPPAVEDPDWPYTPIDRFVQAAREAAGLSVLGDATSEQLIRRAAYTLTGLPPAPERDEALVAAVEAGGDLRQEFASYVDELLSQPSYGERWGRHWMDWVRYADTAGCNSDFPIPQAYLYRNYIIDSLNDDVPYDRFLVEQLAGDLLPYESLEQRNRQIIATGYLAMARRFGSLVETYPWHLTIEDTIDNVGKTMLGLTIACARCHDHKFDPISARDYYGLYGIFESTQYAFPGIELFQVQKDLTSLMTQEEYEKRLGKHDEQSRQLEEALNKELAKCRAKELDNAAKESAATIDERRKMHDDLQRMLGTARKAGNKLADHLKTRPEFPAAYAVRDAAPNDAHIQIKGEPTRPGASVKRRFPTVLGGYEVEDTESSGRLELAHWIANAKNPLTARVIVNRVWERHFGRGLVGSTTDFGLRGETPTHPELLDWLATEFMESGWSLKHLHRLVLNSHTYQLASSPKIQASVFDTNHASAAGVASTSAELNQLSDPTNRYYWRFNRQRLDAESIRDTLLCLSGELDSTPQTKPYPIPPQKDWEYTQHHPFKDDYPDQKRSVYQLTKRLTVESYMQTFDGPDPNVCTSRRDQSVTSLQALFFINDEFLHAQSRRIAENAIAQTENPEERIDNIVALVLNRKAQPHEIKLLVNFLMTLQSLDSPEKLTEADAYASLVRSVVRLNEFTYID
ncbi:MAG: PSD1 and planctomycete cytochrome C domain-containing protein [Aureliella sp.]